MAEKLKVGDRVRFSMDAVSGFDRKRDREACAKHIAADNCGTLHSISPGGTKGLVTMDKLPWQRKPEEWDAWMRDLVFVDRHSTTTDQEETNG